MYFDQEINTTSVTGSKGRIDELQKGSLKAAMSFVRDFEITPYLVH